MRRSRDGRFMEFTCVMTRCDSQQEDACSDPSVIQTPGPLYVGEVPVPLRELVRREGPSPVRHPEVLAAVFAMAAALALFWIARHTPRSTAAGRILGRRVAPRDPVGAVDRPPQPSWPRRDHTAQAREDWGAFTSAVAEALQRSLAAAR